MAFSGSETTLQDAPGVLAGRQRKKLSLRKRLFRTWQGPLGILLITGVALMAVFAPLLAPYDPDKIDILHRLKPPAAMAHGAPGHILGTDEVGRDLLSRLVFGARISLFVGVTTIIIGGVFGSILGIVAGYYGGRVDSIIMRLVDLQLAFPSLLLAIAILAVLGASVTNVILVLSISSWSTFCRVSRGTTLSLRGQEYVQAAHALGASGPRILWRHILPNSWSPLFVVASFGLASNILNEASLSFLGVGIPPTTPSWGGMLGTGKDYLRLAWWVSTFPGIALLITVFSINILGDWIRDLLDPRLQVE